MGHPEPPYFVSESDEELVVGDVVTLEPGMYAPGCSGRIEHVYLITADGPEQMTHHDYPAQKKQKTPRSGAAHKGNRVRTRLEIFAVQIGAEPTR